jgi:hypothetical protein
LDAYVFRDLATTRYFSYDEQRDVVSVRAVWHSSRGSGPQL